MADVDELFDAPTRLPPFKLEVEIEGTITYAPVDVEGQGTLFRREPRYIATITLYQGAARTLGSGAGLTAKDAIRAVLEQLRYFGEPLA